LYKALKTIRRFSEDIDLTVRIDDCSNSQAKKRLERAAQGYESLPRTTMKELENNRKGSIATAYDYETVTGRSGNDPLQRFGHVRIEATSFTVSEPVAQMEVVPEIYERANPGQRQILAENYGVAPFMVDTIRVERIFIDKIFAAEFYYERGENKDNAYFDVAKHIYDVTVMKDLPEIKTVLEDKTSLGEMVAYKRREEGLRIGSGLDGKPFSHFTFWNEIGGNSKLRSVFERMQDIYIFDDSFKLDFDDVVGRVGDMRPVFMELD
jgi:predicted nucleotidyltransferase component of viral defense system